MSHRFGEPERVEVTFACCGRTMMINSGQRDDECVHCRNERRAAGLPPWEQRDTLEDMAEDRANESGWWGTDVMGAVR